MKINIHFEKKSIKDAIDQVKKLQKKVQVELPKVFLQKCVAKIIEIANQNLMGTDIGSEVKSLIQSSWEVYQEEGNRIVLANTAEFESGKNLAVFVEFGVGYVGKGSSHTLANEANYEYDAVGKKDGSGNWYYTLEGGEERMNIESSYYEGYNTEDGLSFKTAGSPATMFLYKAWRAFESLGLYKTIWDEAKKEVIG